METTVVHVPYTYAPDAVGGTENYVRGLARALDSRGFTSQVAAPATGNRTYEHDGTKVWRFGIAQRPLTLDELYGGGDPVAAANFAALLDTVSPQLVHLHACTPAVSVRLVKEANARGIPVVFTYHTPTVSCQRGTLLQWGDRDCDGVLDVRRCAGCALHGSGAPRIVAQCVARVPEQLGSWVARLNLSGGVWTAMRMTHLIRQRHDATRDLMARVNHIVALAPWTQELLVANGVPPGKITYSPHGLVRAEAPPAREPADDNPDRALRIAYLGRLTPTKGAHLLVSAVRSSPALNVRVDLYGIAQGAEDEQYARRLRTLASPDARIEFHAPVPSQDVVNLIKRYDLLAVPSRFTETGPLVVLEAFAAGVPVIGADVRGIRDRVQHGVNGILVAGNSSDAWSAALATVSGRRLAALRCGIQAPRSVDLVAEEVAAVYRGVLDHFRQ